MKAKHYSIITDLHFNSIRQSDTLKYTIKNNQIDALLIAGDIGSPSINKDILHNISEVTKIYYVLGNHDFKDTFIHQYRDEQQSIVNDNITYLTTCKEPIELDPKTCLIGHDGWGDGLMGLRTHYTSLWDFRNIKDFKSQPALIFFHKLRELGTEAATHIHTFLQKATQTYDKIYILTHVPPCPDTCFYQGFPTQPEFLPYMTNSLVFNVIQEYADKYKEKHFFVFSGHTHHKAHFQIDNVSYNVLNPLNLYSNNTLNNYSFAI